MADQAERQLEREYVANIKQQASAAAAAPAAATAPVAAPTAADILAQLNAMGDDKQAKLALLATLSPELNDQVVVALKQQKEEKARLARNAELEDLL